MYLFSHKTRVTVDYKRKKKERKVKTKRKEEKDNVFQKTTCNIILSSKESAFMFKIENAYS